MVKPGTSTTWGRDVRLQVVAYDPLKQQWRLSVQKPSDAAQIAAVNCKHAQDVDEFVYSNLVSNSDVRVVQAVCLDYVTLSQWMPEFDRCLLPLAAFTKMFCTTHGVPRGYYYPIKCLRTRAVFYRYADTCLRMSPVYKTLRGGVFKSSLDGLELHTERMLYVDCAGGTCEHG
jgi:hypothetical protein